MGKIRVKSFGDQEAEAKQEKLAQKRSEEKRVKKMATEPKDTGSEDKTKQAPEPTEEKKVMVKKQKDGSKARIRSEKYTTVTALVDKNKKYPLADALALLPKLKIAKFDETVELHINTTEQSVSGSVVLPHGNGKKIRVAIATEALIAAIEKGTIDFDILVAEPQMMPKLAKVARILGPRGLMPNPKNGTVTPKPEEVAKKYEAGQMNYKTEAKFPIIHLSVGKASFDEKQLSENIKVIVTSLSKTKIKDATLKLTMSPGIKLDIAKV